MFYEIIIVMLWWFRREIIVVWEKWEGFEKEVGFENKFWKKGVMRCWNEILCILGEGNIVNKGMEKEKCVISKIGIFVKSGRV